VTTEHGTEDSTVTTASTRGARRSWRRPLALIGAIVVPLALVGVALAAIGTDDDPLARIPAAVVNDDELITQVDENGEEQLVFAGRQLVTELTGPESAGFDWRVTSGDEAQRMLSSGEVYAVLTIPDDFSASLLTLGEPDAVQAQLQVTTDDAHSYLVGSVVQSVGASLAAQFGDVLTEQYIDGLSTGILELGGALGDAADGASAVGDGVSDLGEGLDALSAGAGASASGARQLADGLSDYTGGVDALADGLDDLAAGAASATPLGDAVTGLSTDAASVASQLGALLPTIQASDLSPEQKQAFIDAYTEAQVVAGTAGAVAPQLDSALSGLATGSAQSAAGAEQLAEGGPALVSGAQGLASGLGELGSGAAEASDGAGQLADGAQELASGLASGAESVPPAGDAAVASEPVVVQSERVNTAPGIGSVLAETLVPVGLWIGALATFLVLRPLERGILGSTATGGAVLRRMLGRSSLIALGQAALVAVLVHATTGVDLALLPATFALSAVIALAFTALHAALTLVLGRAGLIVSLLALVVQLVVTGGLIPVVALAEPFPALSAVMPLTYAVDGMQALLSGGASSRIVAAVAVMLALGITSVIVARLAAGRARRREALASFAPGLAAARA